MITFLNENITKMNMQEQNSIKQNFNKKKLFFETI